MLKAVKRAALVGCGLKAHDFYIFKGGKKVG